MENINCKKFSIKYEDDEYIKIIPNKKNIVENNIVINEFNSSNKLIFNNDSNINSNINSDSNIMLNETLPKNKNKIKNGDYENFYEDYIELKKAFNNFLENVLTGTKEIKNIIKKMDKHTYKNDINKNKLIKKNILVKKEKGFAEEKLVPEPIQIFFNLEKGVKMSRTKVGGLFQEYLKKNNLKGNINEKNKMDKRIYKIDDNLAKLFGLSKEEIEKINSCSSPIVKYPNGYNFFNYQTWIKKIYNENEN